MEYPDSFCCCSTGKGIDENALAELQDRICRFSFGIHGFDSRKRAENDAVRRARRCRPAFVVNGPRLLQPFSSAPSLLVGSSFFPFRIVSCPYAPDLDPPEAGAPSFRFHRLQASKGLAESPNQLIQEIRDAKVEILLFETTVEIQMRDGAVQVDDQLEIVLEAGLRVNHLPRPVHVLGEVLGHRGTILP